MAVNLGDNVSSDSEDPSFSGSDHDDSSSENEVDRFERLAERIFDDSDDDDDQNFSGFPYEMPGPLTLYNVVGRHPVRELDGDYVDDQPHPGPQINLDANAKPIDLFNLSFDNIILQQIVNWTNSNAAKKYENPEKHKGKWTDTNVEKVCAFIACLIMKDMVHVPRAERYF